MSGPLDFTLKDIDGNEVDLSKYKGKVVLLVNVASKCGYTPQYEGLEEPVREVRKDKGFVVLGVPANEFGKQEPGTNEEIKKFCTSKYNVNFPMISKVVVKGDGHRPALQVPDRQGHRPQVRPATSRWNFEKFLIGRDGQVVGRFKPKTKPDDPKSSRRSRPS